MDRVSPSQMAPVDEKMERAESGVSSMQIKRRFFITAGILEGQSMAWEDAVTSI